MIEVNMFRKNVSFWTDMYLLLDDIILQNITKDEFIDFNVYANNKKVERNTIYIVVKHKSDKVIKSIERFHIGYVLKIDFERV